MVLKKMDLLFGFNCELKEMLKMRMQGFTIMSTDMLASASLNAGKIRMSGDLQMDQPNALLLEPNDGIRQVYNDNIFDKLENEGVGDLLD